jgi:hypothetical protein
MDNDKPQLKDLQEIYAALPQDLQEAIMSSQFQNTLIEIGRKYKLTIEQLGNLEMQTTNVLLGVTNPNNYQHELETELGVTDKEIIGKIVEEANEKIFKTIRGSLQEVNQPPEGEPEDDDNETFWRENPEEAARENKVLEKSGIEIEKKSIDEVKIQDEIREEVGGKLDRKDLLQGIENPPKSSTPSFVTQKMTQPSSVPKQETSYTPKNITSSPQAAPANTPPTPPAPPSKPAIDPYREIPS